MSEEMNIPAIRLEVSALKAVNYALQCGGVSIVRGITVINDTDAALENVELKLWTEPALTLPFSKHYDRIGPNTTYRTGALELTLDGGYLSGLTEKSTGLLHVTLELDGEVLFHHSQELTALAFDEWHGYTYYPELLTAFVTPNHPQIAAINARAAELLGAWTGDPSLDAYQTQDPNRVLQLCAAVYGALQEKNIVYSVPPASFEPAGQRVRLCDTLLQQQLGTCLDLTLLYCGCLEAMGLHPLLILQSGHIFAGVWLEDLTFPETVQDDVSLITKRLAQGVSEMTVVECTALTSGKDMSFDQARSAAENALHKGVEYIIDIRRSRLSGITPLPQRLHTDNGWEVIRPNLPEEALTEAPQTVSAPLVIQDADPELLPKMVQWERKLLDLGLRNNLINLRPRRNVVPVLTTSIDLLENTLSSGSDFTVHPRPADYQGAFTDFESVGDLQGFEPLIQSEFQNKRLRAPLTDAELTKALKDLYRSSKTSLEENGANTLYLALGLLRWYETPKSTKARYAPLVLLPIEIVRKSARVGYVLRIRDDEPQMNITLLEKLKQDFRITVSGLDPLPTDEAGVDLRRVLTVMRKAVMNQPRWDVLESAYLGIFSFSQFVMWNDLRNRTEDLQRSKVVRSLMDGRLCWAAQDMTIGDTVPEGGALLPMAADASQLFAIEKANDGESFVLHGPPGTGKSQTITTLIANALAQGRSVLFVAEKMAALEVVQRRLSKIGLGPFCLELHSNKSKKRDVLEQLRAATEVTKAVTPEEYAIQADSIAQLRQELNAYAQGLHRTLPCGKTLFELVDLYQENETAPNIAPFASGFTTRCTPQALNEQATAAECLAAAAGSVGHPQDHPLLAVARTAYSQQLRQELPVLLDRYEAAIDALDETLADFCLSLSLSIPTHHDDLTALEELARELTHWLRWPDTWATAEDPHTFFTGLEEMARHYHNAAGLADQLSIHWTPEFLTQDASSLLEQWDQATAAWFLPRFFGQSGLVRRLNAMAITPVSKDTLRDALLLLQNYQTEKATADSMYGTYTSHLGALYHGERTDWGKICDAAMNARISMGKLSAHPQAGQLLKNLPDSKLLEGFLSCWDTFHAAQTDLEQLLELCDEEGENYLSTQSRLCAEIRDNADKLKDWIAWNGVADTAAELGLGNLVDAVRDGMALEQVLPAYRKALAATLASEAIDSDPALSLFSGAVFNEKIRQFARLDAQLMQLTQQEIYCRLASKVPNFTKEAAHSSELGILQRAIRSGGRGVSIRRLFEQLPNLLPRLCPCMLMSPISAAQYLDPRREPFDIVVFDEASQLPTCKAVGALARGENAVIVGDPKQMPPTAFFATNTVDEENLDAEDLESILDDCLALNIPQTHLLWHYRSRHESLIAYSNSRFYENKLYTFPSVNDRERKVQLIHVDGVFERGKNRQNRAEAVAIVEELKRRCHDENLSKLSVGVVTFNINQQNLIDDLLSEACREDTVLETWAYQSAEPLFIKNLENVQGDERDVILFSVGYGPDEQGKVYMNFGPLNRDGGWRRLNVAITRARQEMTVFATLRPEQIDMNRTAAEGVAALKGFLEYAERGILPQNDAAGKKQIDTAGIIDTIRNFLKKHSFETTAHVGHSAYRIDIGVIDPENPDRYKLGILLDGSSYDAAKTARDREIGQIGVLEGLGWTLHRVWTMDWWDNKEAELQKLLRILTSEPEPQEELPEEIPVTPDATSVLAANLPVSEVTASIPVYTPARLKQGHVSTEDFLLPRYAPGIRKKLEAVITAEAPVSAGLLMKRVVQSYGISRSGSRIQKYLEELLSEMDLLTTTSDDRVFYWKPDQDPTSYNIFRTALNEEDRREARDIPVQEATAALTQVLRDQISVGREDLIRETAKVMGYARLGTAITTLVTDALEYATAQGRVTTDANGNFIPTDPQ